MTGGFGTWQTPGGGFNWNMLANVGAGMLANSQYSPMQALGKGYQQASQDSLEQAKASAIFGEMERKRKADELRQQSIQQLQAALSGGGQQLGQQPTPSAGADIGGAGGFPNTMSMIGRNQPGAQAAPQGGGTYMGVQYTPQQAANARLWLTQGNADKAIEALTAGDPSLTNDTKNYQFLQQHPEAMDYFKMLHPGTTVNLPPQEGALQKGLGEARADVFKKAMDAGPKASQLRGQVQMFNDVMQGVQSGQWAAMKASPAGQWVASLGVNIDGLDQLQAAKAITRAMANNMYVPGKGSQSNAEFFSLLAQVPQISNQPGGNAIISSTLDAVAQSMQQASDIANQVADGTLTASEGMKQINALDPMANWRAYMKEHNIDLHKGVEGAGSTTPNPTNAPVRKWLGPGRFSQ